MGQQNPKGDTTCLFLLFYSACSQVQANFTQGLGIWAAHKDLKSFPMCSASTRNMPGMYADCCSEPRHIHCSEKTPWVRRWFTKTATPPDSFTGLFGGYGRNISSISDTVASLPNIRSKWK
ncbi:hypothetical protein PoB_002185600 [Plakobranchus ocellatus]|uniref:Secreted protein n=1 Tax=Plakobranchus ocellatus TaxID=259542 RepID=A0AAV3ZLE1_9GAST|nr:hypothetical protein PoB_002185600 [Plakobranchus ocellatus]